MFETNESNFIDTSPQSPNFPTNSLIYSKSDMLSRNSDSELTANVGSDRQRNFGFPNKADPFSPKFLDLLNLNVNRALLDNLLQQLTRFEVSAPVCDVPFFEDVKVPLALNHITNVLLVKCKKMTWNIESGMKGYGYAAIQTDRRIKDAVEIAEGDAALRLVVDEKT
ncbi:hypothetical protein ALC53_01447 [Atta colombica]|uniref:Uncharacterized protein n=1 Tax=Atta colombica TaxID=520822 RepID=A0A195BTH9_9HYME|nr:hypothetical protein ALC53_01447 [Atta colombica]